MLQARKDLVHYWCILLRQKVMLIFWISFLFGKAYFQVMNWNGTTASHLVNELQVISVLFVAYCFLHTFVLL